jgi:DNA transposition AAA+ family ATPase
MALDGVQDQTAVRDAFADTRAELQQLIANGLSRSEIARGADVSLTTVSQFMSQTYTGSYENVDAKLRRWLLARAERKALSSNLPTAPEWFEAPTAARIRSALTYAQIAGDLVLVMGGAGLSKSTTCKRYASERPNVWHIEMRKCDATLVPCLERIARVMGVKMNTRAASAIQDAIEAKLSGTQGLLIIDEAQHLSTDALETVRAIQDGTKVGLALVGNESVYARITGGSRAAEFAQLFSRIGKRVRLGKPTKGDVDALADAWSIQAPAARELLQAIAGKPGALRSCTKVLRLAAVIAGGQALDVDHIRSAWMDLGAEG